VTYNVMGNHNPQENNKKNKLLLQLTIIIILWKKPLLEPKIQHLVEL